MFEQEKDLQQNKNALIAASEVKVNINKRQHSRLIAIDCAPELRLFVLTCVKEDVTLAGIHT